MIAPVARGLDAPTPLPSMTVDPALVTPGPIGFVAIALVAVMAILLIVDMLRRIRRARVRLDVKEQLQAEYDQPDPATSDNDQNDESDASEGEQK